jgi:sugar/nucleoside kinase (ribokinase family)
MSLGNSAKDSLEFACVAGALAATKFGATPSLPTKAEIYSVMQN